MTSGDATLRELIVKNVDAIHESATALRGDPTEIDLETGSVKAYRASENLHVFAAKAASLGVELSGDQLGELYEHVDRVAGAARQLGYAAKAGNRQGMLAAAATLSGLPGPITILVPKPI
jgi:hypothetical protein